MKRIFNTVGNIIGVLVIIGVGIVLALTLKGINPADEQPSTFQSPIEEDIPTPTDTPTLTQFSSPIILPTSSSVLPTVPLPTLVIPIPPTVIPNVAIISDKQAVNIAINQSPRFYDLKKSGNLTITTKLTIHGDTDAGTTGDLRFSPQLPVWIVFLHLPPWQETRGPVGREVVVQFNAERFEIDATTGKVIGEGRSYIDESSSTPSTIEETP